MSPRESLVVNSPLYESSGDPALFLAKLTAVSGTGSAAKYAFTEHNVVAGTGGTEARVSGRRAVVLENPARYAGGGTLAVDDIVLARRNVADPNEYEILGLADKPLADVTETIGPFVSGVSVASVVCNADGTITVTLSVTTKTQTLTVTDGVLNITDPA